MLTLKLITEETERVIKGLEKKHFKNAKETIEKVLAIDKQRRESQQTLDKNKQEANQLSKKIGALVKDKKMDEANAIKAQVATLKAEAKTLQETMEAAEKDLTTLLYSIPNGVK